MSKRYYLSSPRCGDVWFLKNGKYLLIDYVTCLQIGFVLSDKTSGSYNYTQSLENYLKQQEAILILASEDSGFPASDSKGFILDSVPWTLQKSFDFLAGVIKNGGKGDSFPCQLNNYNFE